MGEFPNKATQFSSENQPANSGRKFGSLGTKAILKKFLDLEMNQVNPFTKEIEKMSVAELMALVQIKKALKGELQSWKEILDRTDGKVEQKIDAKVSTENPIFDKINLDVPTNNSTDKDIETSKES